MTDNLPTTGQTPMADFQARVLKRLQDDIGALMPVEALGDMVERAVEETFFKERVVGQGRYHGDKPTMGPSWFVEKVCEQAEGLITQQVTLWVDANQKTIYETIDKFLESQNIAMITATIMAERTSGQFEDAIMRIINHINMTR